jgi:hypothetical protein
MQAKGLIVAAATLVLAAATAHAQRRVFEWTGRVDNDVEISLRGGAFLMTRVGTDERVSQGKSELTALPGETGDISIRVAQGRGAVQVVQDPTPDNGYTAVIRVSDPGPGADTYRIAAYWQPVAAGEVVRMSTVPPAPPVVVPRITTANRTELIWSGDVDSELEIIVRPGGITYNTIRGDAPRRLESALNSMPWPNAMLDINQIEGRGEASITQQPSAENGYTAKIRVRDPQPGFGHYVFMALWR